MGLLGSILFNILPKSTKRQVKHDFLLTLSKQSNFFEKNPLGLNERVNILIGYWMIIIPKLIFEGMFLEKIKELPKIIFDNKVFPVNIAYITQAFVMFQLREIINNDKTYFDLFDGNLLQIITKELEEADKNGVCNCFDIFSQLNVYNHFIEQTPYYYEKRLLSDKNKIFDYGDILQITILKTYYTLLLVEQKKYSDILLKNF